MHPRRATSFALAALAVTATLGSPISAQLQYEVEPNHSTIGFSVPIAGGLTKVTGKFSRFAVTIVHHETDLTAASVTARIEAGSIDTGIDQRDEDLRGPQFFDVERYPEIVFESTRVEARDLGFVAFGTLRMRGTEKTIAIPFTLRTFDDEEGDRILAVSARIVLNRLDFGVGADWRHTAIPNFLGEEIGVEIDVWTRGGQPLVSSGDGE